MACGSSKRILLKNPVLGKIISHQTLEAPKDFEFKLHVGHLKKSVMCSESSINCRVAVEDVF